MRPTLAALALAMAGAAHAQADCRPDPLEGRALYLRGSFNAWAAADAQRLRWACHRFVLVTPLSGEHQFKIGDEGWSADADFGRVSDAPDVGDDPARPQRLALRGRDIRQRFAAGTYRISLAMNDPQQPVLSIEPCPSDAAPLGATRLFLRGTMNNWAALDDYAFQYSCDAYYLNVDVTGRHEFKVADAGWTGATSYGAGTGPYLKEGGANVERNFTGAHTLRLAWAGGRPELSIGPKTFADRNTVAVTDPVARSIAFDSRSPAHKKPFGAVVAGRGIDFAVDALPGVAKMTLVVERRRLEGNQEILEYTELARVPMTKTAQDAKERWSASHRFAEIGIYGYWFEAELADGSRYAFQNNRDSVHWTREKGSGGAGEIGELPKQLGTVRRFRQTVYAADFHVPDWASDIVYYYIFPERFRNGDKRNDPKVGRDKVKDSGVEVHPRWNEKPFRPGSGDGSDAVHSNDFFGGDLAGIIDKLDYIRELGANTIYMTPVFQAPSNHKYDTADYTRIDPAFGTNADFERLTREAARRGIRVIPDTSLNHVGSDSTYFNRFGNFPRGGAFDNGRINPASPYASWFTFDATQSDPDRQYKGWVGINDLPELNKASPAWRDFAYKKRDSVMKQWLDRGAAGWRMDVAPWVPDDFWREWRAEIKRHKPDALTVSETWFDSSKYLLGDMFDSTMNYIFRNAVLEYAAGGSAKSLVAQLELLREAYPPQAHSALMNLLSTHDAARALHQFGFHDAKDAPATIALAKRRLLLAVFIQMTYPGAPTIYYGDEVGVTGGEDPFNRATYPWEDEGGQPDRALLAAFKKLTALRHAHPILRRGELLAPVHVDDQVVVHARRLASQWALTAFNNGAASRPVTVALPAGFPSGALVDALDGRAVAVQGGRVTIDVGALAGRVLLTR
ncbi:MAG TPA: glycoside hydrolase family 13 protein [Burkholderiaceae bacterium]|nr:glycoside hydrolase family 13 protein [Burkholderiaceae bacterium]